MLVLSRLKTRTRLSRCSRPNRIAPPPRCSSFVGSLPSLGALCVTAGALMALGARASSGSTFTVLSTSPTRSRSTALSPFGAPLILLGALTFVSSLKCCGAHQVSDSSCTARSAATALTIRTARSTCVVLSAVSARSQSTVLSDHPARSVSSMPSGIHGSLAYYGALVVDGSLGSYGALHLGGSLASDGALRSDGLLNSPILRLALFIRCSRCRRLALG